MLLGAGESIRDIEIDRSGRIVIAAISSHYDMWEDLYGADSFVHRLRRDGSTDPKFSDDGRLREPYPEEYAISGLALLADGRIATAGEWYPDDHPEASSPTDYGIALYRANGKPDTSFSGDGRLTLDIGGYRDDPGEIVASADGLVVAGYAAGIGVARIQLNGVPDPSFSDDGIQQTTVAGASLTATDLVLMPDGRIVVAGERYSGTDVDAKSDLMLAAFDSAGELDENFGVAGIQTTDLSRFDSLSSIAIDRRGKLVVGGEAQEPNGNSSEFLVARYRPLTGRLDRRFGNAGHQQTNFGVDHASASVYDLAIDARGRIVAVGAADGPGDGDDLAMARYLP